MSATAAIGGSYLSICRSTPPPGSTVTTPFTKFGRASATSQPTLPPCECVNRITDEPILSSRSRLALPARSVLGPANCTCDLTNVSNTGSPTVPGPGHCVWAAPVGHLRPPQDLDPSGFTLASVQISSRLSAVRMLKLPSTPG